MTYRPSNASSSDRTPSYLSPFSGLTVPVSAPASSTYGAQYNVYAYPLDIATGAVVDKVFAGVGAPNALWRVAYGGGTWVAVGDAGMIATSTDGNDWTRRTSGVTSILYGVAYSGGTWVAVGETGVVRTATDPAGTWSAAASPGFGTNSVWSVMHDGTRWIANGASGTIRYATSAGGTWSAAASPGFGTNIVRYIATDGTNYVAVGDAGSVRTTTDPTGTWTAAASPGFGVNTVWSVAYAGGTWVAAGPSGSIRTTTSSAGTWTAVASAGFASVISSVIHDGTRWVASGVSDLRYTTNAAGTWVQPSTPVTAGWMRSLAYAAGTYVTVSSIQGRIRYTTDPTATWSASGNDTCQVGIYRSDGTLVTSGTITLSGNASSQLLYNDITDVQLAPGSYYIALWSGEPGWGQFFRTSSTTARLRARFVQTGQTSGLPSTLTLAQETTGLVYLFGFTTK